MMRNNATEEFKMKCHTDMHGASSGPWKYPPPARGNTGLPALVIVGAAILVAGIILALIF